MSWPDDADAHPRPPWSVTFPRTRARRQAEAPAPVTGWGAVMSGCSPRTETHPADAPAQGSGAMMTAMTTPESGDVAARLAQASRLIRHAQSLAEKIAELTEDELASLCGLAANNHDQDQDPHGNEGNDGEQPGPPRHAPTTEPASTHGPRFYADTHAMPKSTGSRPADALTARQSARHPDMGGGALVWAA